MKRNGYSIIEVLVAAGVIALAIGAGAVLARSSIMQADSNARVARAANLHEQVATLYRLGYDLSVITNVLPENFVTTTPTEPDTFRLTFGVATNAISGSGSANVQMINSTLVFQSGLRTDGSFDWRSNSAVLVRPTIR